MRSWRSPWAVQERRFGEIRKQIIKYDSKNSTDLASEALVAALMTLLNKCYRHGFPCIYVVKFVNSALISDVSLGSTAPCPSPSGLRPTMALSVSHECLYTCPGSHIRPVRPAEQRYRQYPSAGSAASTSLFATLPPKTR